MAVPTPRAKLTFIKLHPKFDFVIKHLELRRRTSEYTKEEQIFLIAKLSYKGPKPSWWNDFHDYTITFVTDKGREYRIKNANQGEDHTEGDSYVLYTYLRVPKLTKSERVVKVESLFEIKGAGLVRCTMNVPAKRNPG
jgi:hypothetical protein